MSSLHMNNSIKSIFERQNRKDNLLQLMAMRRLYSNAKFVNSINFFISVMIPVLIALGKGFIEHFSPDVGRKITPYLAYYGIGVLLVTIFTGGIVSRLKKKAATIQEMFDCDVLSIQWNELKIGKKISHSIVLKHSRYYKKRKKDKDFTNWYIHNHYDLPSNKTALLCQYENIGWDISQREVVSKLYATALIVTLILLITYGVYSNALLEDFLFYIVFLLPLFRHFFIQFKENKGSIDKINRINDYLEKKIDEMIELKLTDDQIDSVVRAVQDEIYSHRATSNPMPDFIHKLFKNKNEIHHKENFDFYYDKLK